jgi:hypothetical protein
VIQTQSDAIEALDAAWPLIAEECRTVLGSELHYQAMIYHALRTMGRVPVSQIGMNVKQWIPNVRSELFVKFDLAKHVNYRGGFEPIPDIVIFNPGVGGDWRRRRFDNTIKCMLAAIEVKASERALSRLSVSEIAGDIEKLVAHRQEAKRLGSDFYAAVIVVDTAPLVEERMRSTALAEVRRISQANSVEFRYLSPFECVVDRPYLGESV